MDEDENAIDNSGFEVCQEFPQHEAEIEAAVAKMILAIEEEGVRSVESFSISVATSTSSEALFSFVSREEAEGEDIHDDDTDATDHQPRNWDMSAG